MPHKLRLGIVLLAVLLVLGIFASRETVNGQSTLYRAINFNGAAVVVDGISFQSSTGAANFVRGSTTYTANSNITLVPSTDANRTALLRSFFWGNNFSVRLTSVPNGSYDVYLYTVEDSGAEIFNILLQGITVVANYNSGSVGAWSRLGPYTVNVTNGEIALTTTGGWANFSAIEVYTRSGGITATPSNTVVSSATPSRTSSATIGASATPSNTATPTVTRTRTATATASLTPTQTPTSAPLPSGLYRAINLNGAALLIDGIQFEAGAPPTTMQRQGTTAFCNQNVALNPATDANRATMIRCSYYGGNPRFTLQTVPNGTYDVYLYTWEDNNSETFTISVQSVVVQSNYVSGTAGTWRKLGPYTANVTAGTLLISSTGGSANFSGFEIYRRATTSPTPTSSMTPSLTPSLTSTLTPSATATTTATPTETMTPSITNTPSETATATETPTPTETATETPTLTPSLTDTPTETLDPSITPSATSTLTPTATETATSTATVTPTETPTLEPSATWTPSPTWTPTATLTPSATPSYASMPRLTVSANGRYVMTADGHPFFWTGDTAWDLFQALTREETELYLENRRQKGFNIIQAVILTEWNTAEPNAYGNTALFNLNPLTPNDAYFQHVDWVLQLAAQKGLYVAVLPTWGDKVNLRDGAGPVIFNTTNARPYGLYVGTRYRNYTNIIWMFGGDRDVANATQQTIWNEMAAGIEEGVGGPAMFSYHPEGWSVSSQWFNNLPWFDINSYQSGHSFRDTPAWDWSTDNWALTPVKPLIDSEQNYEDIPVNFIPSSQGYFTEYDVRKQAYRTTFAGNAGVTYGHNSIWQFFAPGDWGRFGPPMYWYEALDRPGAFQMQYLRYLIESRPFLNRIPDQGVLASANGTTWATHIRATRADDGSYAFVYLPVAATFSVNLAKISGSTVRAWWYDPRTGASTLIGEFPTGGTRQFTTPSSAVDWVLVLDDAARGFTAPGRGS